jgi:uncharacterized membrane protein
VLREPSWLTAWRYKSGSVSRYELLLFAHVALAMIWLGGGVMAQFFALRALRAETPARLADVAADIQWIGTRVLTPTSLGVLGLGIALVLDGPWSFGDDWVVIGLTLFAVTFAAGAAFFGPESGRIADLIRSEGVESPLTQARIRRVLALTRADIVLLFLIAYDMVLKPSFGDTRVILTGLLVATLLAALLVWRGLAMTPRASVQQ